MKKEFFYIQGMTCTACSGGIERSLKRKKGIESINVDLLNHCALVTYDENQSSLEEIFAFIKKLGYTPQKQGLVEKLDSCFLTPTRKIILAAFFTGIVVFLSMGSMLAPLPLPPQYNIALQLFCTLIVMHLGRDFYLKGFKALFALSPNMDTLVALGSGSAFVYSLFELRSLHSLYFESVCVILLFILIGKTIESKAKDNTQNALQTLLSLQQHRAKKIQVSQEIDISAEEIETGDILKISPQEIIPTDGIIIKGYGNLDLSSLNGESLPQHRKIGQSIPSGALNLNTSFLMRATCKANQSSLSQILNTVQNALLSKAPIAKITDKIAMVFVPSILIVASLAFIFWLSKGMGIDFAIQIFCSVLLISCPCALGLATPLALNIAIKLASQKGIFFKNAQILEHVGKVKTVFFDKTGTITQSKLRLKKIIPFKHLQEEELISICASLEQNSHHIIASSLLQIAQEKNLILSEAQEVQIQEGFGIQGKIQGALYKIGNAKSFHSKVQTYGEGIEIFIAKIHQCQEEMLGCILLEDLLKNEAKECIQKLKSQNIEVFLLSGDHQKNVQKIANALQIPYIADALAQDKCRTIQSHQHSTMMVGDGINDMLALSYADVSVSMGEGSQGAIASSNLVIFNNNLLNINYAIALSQATLSNIKQNLFWAFGYNICMIPLACGALYGLGITLNPMFSAFAMTLSSLSVVINAQRLKKFKEK